MSVDQPIYDVAVIGAGVVGSAIARELSRYELTTVLLEAGPDVGVGTSKANTAIWHTGYDAKPGSQEAQLIRRSYKLLETFVSEAGVPVERLGGLLVAWTEEQHRILPDLLDQAHQNGESGARIISSAELYELEPNLKSGAYSGLHIPREGIICTFTLPLALATQAVLNGVALRLDFSVSKIRREQGATYVLSSQSDAVRCRYVVNAAGLHADELNHLLGHHEFTVTPRRGELIVLDKFARSLVNHVLLPVPSAKTKGVLISPTVYGNVLLGPTAEDLADKEQTGSSAEGLSALLEKGAEILPDLLNEEVTAVYAGLRAATEHSDYQIHAHPSQRYVCVGGIRSTGVSGSMGIAEYVVELLAEAGLTLTPKTEFKSMRMPYIGEAEPRPYQSEEMISANRDYGHIICYCENVTRGEILDAIHAVIPARNLSGLRRRTRTLQGRCQGFNCHAAVTRMLAQETGQSISDLLNLEAPHEA